MDNKFYVTTSIPYVNGEPHFGHALEFICADVLARYARSQGKTTLLSTGTDEHGGKITEKAEEKSITPKQFADQMSQHFRDLTSLLNISEDRFIRTTDPGHIERAQLIWDRLKNDIYKNNYEGWYCTGDEAFFPEATVNENNGVCPNHDRPYEKVKEENYFFKLSKYSDQIKQAIETDAFRVVPKSKQHEILSVLNDGLDDISISRPKDKIYWGVPVPGDEDQVIYVWFEALMNYITVLGYPEHQDFKTFWPADVQVIGKDILRFHAAIWPAVLLALELPLPRSLYVHGFVTVDGRKISKSLGNAIHPEEIIQEYGADAFRYYFLRHIPSYGDGDFSWQKFRDAYNNELANELGNTMQRTASMISQYQDGVIGNAPEGAHDIEKYIEAMDDYQFDKALDEIWSQIKGLNQYIDQEKPWQIHKEGDSEHLQEVLAYQAGSLVKIAELLEPFLPGAAEKIKYVFDSGIVRPLDGTLFPKKELADSSKQATEQSDG